MVTKGDPSVKKGLSFLIAAIVLMLMVSGCGYPTSINVKDLSMNGGQLTSVKLTREGKTGTTYTLSGKSAAPKGGQAKVSFQLETEKGKEKAEVVFDVAEGKAVAFTQEVTPKGKIKSVTATAFTYEPYEFTSKDYPTEPGLKVIYFSEKTETSTATPARFAVSLNLTGPWDLTAGPTEGEVVYNYVGPKDTEQAVEFPDANAAREQDYGGEKDIYYYRKTSEAQQILGRSTKTLLSQVAAVSKYNPPQSIWKFPFKVGDSWSYSSTGTVTGLVTGQSKWEGQLKVMARGSVKVPQGEYDKCYLVQERSHVVYTDATEDNTIDYTWIVPGIGPVAYLTSVNGETNEVFTQASSFMRLKYFGKSKPGS